MTAVAERPVSTSGRSLLTNSAILSGTTLAVSAANYLLNLVLARLLDPAAFSDVSLVVNLVMAGALVAATLQMVASKAIAAAPGRREAVRSVLLRAALGLGAVTLVGLAGGATVLAQLLNASTPWLFVILGVSLPVYFLQAVHRGLLQGELRFPRLALSYGVEALVRVAVTIGLVVAGFGVLGAAWGVAASFVASALVARVRRVPDAVDAGTGGIGLAASAVGATALLVGQTVVNTADLVVAKAAFTPAVAGVYAAAALVGRAVFFVSSSVTSSVFPVVAREDVAPSARRRAVLAAVALVVAVGAGAVLASWLGGDLLVSLAFGPAYAAAAPLLVPYALATALFALASLLAAMGVARHRNTPAFVLVAGAVLQTVALVLWGTTPAELAWLQVAGMGATVLAILAVQRARA